MNRINLVILLYVCREILVTAVLREKQKILIEIKIAGKNVVSSKFSFLKYLNYLPIGKRFENVVKNLYVVPKKLGKKLINKMNIISVKE